MDRIPVRMIRANNNHIDTVEREKEEHEKQYEEVSANYKTDLSLDRYIQKRRKQTRVQPWGDGRHHRAQLVQMPPPRV